MNIPIYRAKKIGSDEYVEGFYFNYWNKEKHYIGTIATRAFTNKVNEWTSSVYEIDPTTLAIHFSDMIDSQGNKIFASLNNIGGSILTDGEYEFNLYFDGIKYRVIGNEVNSEINDYEEWKDFKVIGIQE